MKARFDRHVATLITMVCLLVQATAVAAPKRAEEKDEATGIAVSYECYALRDGFLIIGKARNTGSTPYASVDLRFDALDRDDDRIETIRIPIGAMAANGSVPFERKGIQFSQPGADVKRLKFSGIYLPNGEKPGQAGEDAGGITEEKKGKLIICRDPKSNIAVQFEWTRVYGTKRYELRGKVRNESSSSMRLVYLTFAALARDGDKMGDTTVSFRDLGSSRYAYFEALISNIDELTADKLRKVTLIAVDVKK